MVATINQNYINQFSADLYHLINQKGSKLKGLFSEEMAKGEKHFFDRLGEFTVSERVSRAAPTVLQDAAHSRRMATVKLYDAAVFVDKLDLNKMLIDPTSDYAVKLANVHGRNYDEELIDALLGTAATGADGSGSQAFDTSNQQIAHGSTGLTVAKLNQAVRVFEGNEYDMDSQELYLLVNARGVEDLMGESEFSSFDFQNVKALAGKQLPQFRGINIVRTQRMPDETAGTTFRAILCTADALKVAISEDMKVEVDKRPDLSNIMQVYTSMMFGAVRMEEKAVVDILFQ